MKKLEESRLNDECFETVDPRRQGIYLVGGVAAFGAVAIVIFEFVVVTIWPPPTTVLGWFTLFENNRILGLLDYAVLDAVIVALLGPMFVALFFALRRTHEKHVAVAVPFVFAGIASYWATNSALAMLYLSDLYAAATTESQRTAFLESGQALNSVSQYGLFYSMGFFLVVIAGLIVSVAMLRGNVFNKATAYLGLAGNILVLGNYISLALASTNNAWLAAFAIVGGILLFAWWALTGLTLYRLGRKFAS